MQNQICIIRYFVKSFFNHLHHQSKIRMLLTRHTKQLSRRISQLLAKYSLFRRFPCGIRRGTPVEARRGMLLKMT